MLGMSRQEQDDFAVRSQNLACQRIEEGFWAREITPVTLPDGTVVSTDDGPRRGTTLEAVGQLKPVFRPDGTVTAGNACPLNDGAAALVVMSDVRAKELADVTLDGVTEVLVLVDAEPAVRRALDEGAALMASEQLGLARWCLESTVAHLQVRKQFGRVLGGFQALKHRLADLYTGVESGAAAARYAAVTSAEGDPDATVAASIAQAYLSDLAVRAAEEAVQLHGGIGMTWEHPAPLFLKRAKSDQIALGTPGRHRACLGTLVDLGP